MEIIKLFSCQKFRNNDLMCIFYCVAKIIFCNSLGKIKWENKSINLNFLNKVPFLYSTQRIMYTHASTKIFYLHILDFIYFNSPQKTPFLSDV